MRYDKHYPPAKDGDKEAERFEDILGITGDYDKPDDLDLALVGDDSSLPEREIL